ncbi:MAG TPA: response regulator [Hyphomicrobiaceae bacterium]|nr:response regulator [Hyphomicrobiaceae bacterium]
MMTHSTAQNETVVLLVEDDRDDFFLTQDVLQCVPNHKYSVVWAGSYERATFELLERSYDVALVDYRIGERTGLEFIREAGRRFTDTPMILLTGVIDPHIDREAEEAGAADFLEKGAITPELLDRSIRYAIKHARRRALLDAVLSNSAAGIVALDRSGAPILWNKQALRALAVEGNAEGAVTSDMVSAGLTQIRNGGRLPEQFVAASGEVFETGIGSVPSDGEVIVFHEITHRIRAEELLRKSVAEAEAANMAKSSFLATMSHELRTPMNGILGMARVLANTPLDQEQGAYLDTIRVSGESLLGIINDVLDLSKIEAGHLEIENVEYRIGDLAHEVTTLLAPTARAKGIDLAAFVDPQLGSTMRGDPLRVRQIITNLIGNAIKFTDEGGVSLWVERLESDGETHLRIRVSDTGMGIPESKRERLFKRFSQVDASTTRTHGGTGLGLALCREFVSLMGGQIDCESTPGVGSTFIVKLPLLDGGAAALSAGHGRLLSGWRLALIGREGPLANVMRAYATSSGATMDLLACGPNVLQRLGSTNGTAIVIDCSTAKSGRDEIVRLIAEGSSSQSMPFFVIADTVADAGGIDLEPDMLLSRPFGQQSFERICNRLRRRTSSSGKRATAASAVTPPRHLRVLLAEDNEPNQRVARAILRGAGYAIDIAGNGHKAIELVGQKPYDVVLMDVNMPSMDGLEATQIIRQTDAGRSLPIIGLTASVMDGDRQRCLEAGMNDHLAKPIDWDTLIALLNRMEGEVYGTQALAS